MKFLETYYCEYLLCLHGKQKGTRKKTFYNNRRGRGRTTTKIKPAPQNSLVIFFKCINNKNGRTAKKKLGGIFSSDCLLSLKTVVAHRMRCSGSEKLNKILLVSYVEVLVILSDWMWVRNSLAKDPDNSSSVNVLRLSWALFNEWFFFHFLLSFVQRIHQILRPYFEFSGMYVKLGFFHL